MQSRESFVQSLGQEILELSASRPLFEIVTKETTESRSKQKDEVLRQRLWHKGLFAKLMGASHTPAIESEHKGEPEGIFTMELRGNSVRLKGPNAAKEITLQEFQRDLDWAHLQSTLRTIESGLQHLRAIPLPSAQKFAQTWMNAVLKLFGTAQDGTKAIRFSDFALLEHALSINQQRGSIYEACSQMFEELRSYAKNPKLLRQLDALETIAAKIPQEGKEASLASWKIVLQAAQGLSEEIFAPQKEDLSHPVIGDDEDIPTIG